MSQFLDSLAGRKVYVDDDPKYEMIIAAAPQDKLKPCALCGELFIKQRRGVYCSRQHYIYCINCGKRIDLNQSHFYSIAPKTCSKKCADAIGVITYKNNCLEKYGVTNLMLIPKQVKNMIAKRNPNFDFNLKEQKQIRKCEVCGNEFEFDYTRPRRCCSKECSSQLHKLAMQQITKVCEYCGAEFITSYKRTKYCNGPHYAECKICGKKFIINALDNIPNTCSAACADILRRQTCLDRYGVEIGSQSVQAKEKLSIAGKLHNPKKPKEELPKPPIIKLCRICNQPFTLESNAQHICSKQHYRNCDVCGKQYKFNAPWTQRCCSVDCTQSKRVSTQKTSLGADGTPLDSSWEKIVYDFWKSIGLEVERNIPIEYSYGGKLHTTFIDFRVDGILYEIKGNHLLNGSFDYSGVPIGAKLDIYRKNHVVIITDFSDDTCGIFGKPNSTISNGLKYLDKCPEPLIGIDIELFKDVPKFPYAEDRPKCFYDVKVSGMRSAHEAFYDPNIRWKMIVNRIMYTGGFIDNKQVLTAMNVSRICKQPSWFSEKFAEELISKYCTSDTIVDPFAGWGARYDASIALGKQYIGIDLNNELVAWHKSKGRSIELGDAITFTYSGSCSVFICPPYQDIEVYFEGQNSKLTQCDWLALVMQNVPNASEYLMVCKVVDPGWEKYVVDTKENKSHFGTNKEYIILITQKDKSLFRI